MLRSRLEAVANQIPRALEPGNVDGVHDTRVAVRRFLTALRDLAPLFADGKPKGLNREIRLLARTLGSVRDHDVAIIELEKLLAVNTDEKVDDGIRGLIETRNYRRAEAFVELQDLLTETRMAEINRRLEKFIGRLSGFSHGDTGRDFAEVGRDMIRKRQADFVNGIRQIYDPFNSLALHKLRIETKRLRYAIQLFANPGNPGNSPVADEIGRLQSCLGEMHDCDVWTRKLSRMLKRRFKTGATSGSDYAAAEWLLGEFVKKRSRSYRDALDICNAWRQTDFLTEVSQLTESK